MFIYGIYIFHTDTLPDDHIPMTSCSAFQVDQGHENDLVQFETVQFFYFEIVCMKMMSWANLNIKKILLRKLFLPNTMNNFTPGNIA